MRSRKIKKQIWLSDEEDYIMKCKSESVGMNSSDYIRHLIMGYKPKEKPSENFYEDIKPSFQTASALKELGDLSSKINNYEFKDIAQDKSISFVMDQVTHPSETITQSISSAENPIVVSLFEPVFEKVGSFISRLWDS